MFFFIFLTCIIITQVDCSFEMHRLIQSQFYDLIKNKQKRVNSYQRIPNKIRTQSNDFQAFSVRYKHFSLEQASNNL